MLDNSIYQLSNSDMIIHHEKGIVHTRLGILFNKKIHDELGLSVVVSSLIIGRTDILMSIKVRGFQGGKNGIISHVTEKRLTNIFDRFCKRIWELLTESIEECNIPPISDLISDSEGNIKHKLSVEIVDFEKRSRIGFFRDELNSLEKIMREEFSSVDFQIRACDDDRHLYYIIFCDEKNQKLAEELYGLSKMTDRVWELCRCMDEYGIFTSYSPEAMITHKDCFTKGELMAINRNNLNMPPL